MVGRIVNGKAVKVKGCLEGTLSVSGIETFHSKATYLCTNMPNTIGGNKRDGVKNVILDVYLLKEDEYWVAVAPAVHVSGYGKTQAEAKASFEVELKIFIEETEKRGTLERLLIEYGWTLSSSAYVPPPTMVVPGAMLNNPNYSPRSYRSRVRVPASA